MYSHKQAIGINKTIYKIKNPISTSPILIETDCIMQSIYYINPIIPKSALRIVQRIHFYTDFYNRISFFHIRNTYHLFPEPSDSGQENQLENTFFLFVGFGFFTKPAKFPSKSGL